MKLYYIECGDELIADAKETLNYAQELANDEERCVEVYNWAPGCHKHNSLYLALQPETVSDTPMAEMYGG